MTRQELEDLNAELIELLRALRDQIGEKLDELEATEEDVDDEEIGEED